MSKHMKFIVTVLFAVILLLTAAILKFYSDTGKSTGEGSAKIDVEKKLGSDSKGNRIFEDSSGLYGVIDTNERVVIDPQWIELKFVGDNLCMVSRRLNGKLMTGCIDYEGNIVVPMIYRDIIKQSRGNFVFYTAYPAAGDSCVLYDIDFAPLFRRSWESCSLAEDEMILTSPNGTYTYNVDYTGLTLKSAVLEGTALDCGYQLTIQNMTILSELDPDMLDALCAGSGRYIEYAFTGSREYLSDVRTDEKSVFTTIFPDDKKILSKKLTGLSGIRIYKVSSDDDKQHYTVSMTADTEIAYTDDEDMPQTLEGSYRAIIEFCGTSANDLAAVSGKFQQSTPDYPAPPDPENNTENQDATAEAAG